jgi:hypothetical protein
MKNNLVKIPSQMAEAHKPGIGWGSFATLKLSSGKGLPLLGLAWNVRVRGAANYGR